MREFVSAGGELMIHAALHSKNSPTPELVTALKPIPFIVKFPACTLLP